MGHFDYEASEHCEACALARFGRNDLDEIDGTDSEGNSVGAVFEPFEDRDMVCGTCETVISELPTDEDPDDDDDDDEPNFSETDHAEFVNGYCEAADFANNDKEDVPEVYDFKTEIERDCHDFLEANATNIRRYCDELNRSLDSAGVDFYFTRNRHGAGFWDRSSNELHTGFLRELTDAAHAYGPTEY